MEKIERVINWFDKTTEKLKGEINIDHIKLDQLKMIFSPPPDDPLMIKPFVITQAIAEQLKQIVDIEFLFEKYDYYLECFKAEG